MVTINELLIKHNYDVSSSFSDPAHESAYSFEEFVTEYNVWKAEQDAIAAALAAEQEELVVEEDEEVLI